VGDDPSWEEKRDDRLLWRGKNTGMYFKDGVPWSECCPLLIGLDSSSTEHTLAPVCALSTSWGTFY
jgi:hypothetical protein